MGLPDWPLKKGLASETWNTESTVGGRSFVIKRHILAACWSRVLPFHEEKGAEFERVLTDNGREARSRPLQHFYPLLPALHQTEHRRKEVRSPKTNGLCERFHRTVKEEFFTVAFRKTFYEILDQLQADLDRYLDFYNRERAYQGDRTKGRTPWQAFSNGLALRPQQQAA